RYIPAGGWLNSSLSQPHGVSRRLRCFDTFSPSRLRCGGPVMPPAWYAASVHIYGSRGAAYVSPLCFRSDRAADGGAALCRAYGLRPGPAGGAGPLRRTAAFVAVPV